MSYALQSYWEDRFKKNKSQFEWLSTPDHLYEYLLKEGVPKSLRVLHVGCGSSEVHLDLQRLAAKEGDRDWRVINIDYAQSAIDLGVEKEMKLLVESKDLEPSEWLVADLLKIEDLEPLIMSTKQPLAHPGLTVNSRFTVIIDKSTADSLSCCEDAIIPPHVNLLLSASPISDPQQERIEPVLLFSLNMAYVVPPSSGGLWLCFSFSAWRMDFLKKGYEDETDARLLGFWEVEDVKMFSTEEVTKENVGTPEIYNYLYVLRRTDKPIRIG